MTRRPTSLAPAFSTCTATSSLSVCLAVSRYVTETSRPCLRLNSIYDRVQLRCQGTSGLYCATENMSSNFDVNMSAVAAHNSFPHSLAFVPSFTSYCELSLQPPKFLPLVSSPPPLTPVVLSAMSRFIRSHFPVVRLLASPIIPPSTVLLAGTLTVAAAALASQRAPYCVPFS